MTRVRYVGELPHAHWQGQAFPRDEWVDDHGLEDHNLELLAGNPTFDVEPAAPEASRATAKATRSKPKG